MTCADLQEKELETHYRRYVEQLPQDLKLAEVQQKTSAEMVQTVQPLTEEQLLHSYAEGKWTIKEILVHLMDAERIFCYRALCFAREDMTEIVGFDHNAYIKPSMANERTKESILEEYKALRASTVLLFAGLSPKALTHVGVASKSRFSVRGLGFLIAGHEVHHMRVMQEKYF